MDCVSRSAELGPENIPDVCPENRPVWFSCIVYFIIPNTPLLRTGKINLLLISYQGFGVWAGCLQWGFSAPPFLLFCETHEGLLQEVRCPGQ